MAYSGSSVPWTSRMHPGDAGFALVSLEALEQLMEPGCSEAVRL